MRFRWPFRVLSVAVYFCIILLVALQHSFYDEPHAHEHDHGPVSDGKSRALPEIDNETSIVGAIPKEIGTVVVNDPNRKATILMWMSGEIGPQHLGGCPDYNCEITSDQRLLNISDAIVFHNGIGNVPAYRSSSQFYVFFTQESPVHMSVGSQYSHNFFNLTLGFRRDADVPCPYGYAIKRREPWESLPKEMTKLIDGKDRLVAWFVSNCGAPSGRDVYVAELKKYIDVDVYGGCGTMTCPKSEDCNALLEKRYKFYLAFENSLCKDYATEKFWEKMTLNIVTVVLKRSMVDKHAPPGSFIAADDFDSPRSLAMYLKQLHEDPVLYLGQFEWRRQYEIIFLNGRVHDRLERPWCFCKLCRRLLETPSRSKSYSNLDEWWINDAKCDHDLVPRLVSKPKSDKTRDPR